MVDFHELMKHAVMSDDFEHDFVDWHGWQVPNLANVAVHVGSLPGRERKCLYVDVVGRHGNYIDVLAYFRNQHYARAGLTVIDKFAEVANRQ